MRSGQQRVQETAPARGLSPVHARGHGFVRLRRAPPASAQEDGSALIRGGSCGGALARNAGRNTLIRSGPRFVIPKFIN